MKSPQFMFESWLKETPILNEHYFYLWLRGNKGPCRGFAHTALLMGRTRGGLPVGKQRRSGHATSMSVPCFPYALCSWLFCEVSS